MEVDPLVPPPLFSHLNAQPTLANPYLEDFYKAPKVYGLKMQLWLLRLRFHTYVAACKYIIATGKGPSLS